MPVDILAGTDRLRGDINRGRSLEDMEKWWQGQSRAFKRRVRARYLMYK
jgi:hypothetical protein